MGYFYMVVFTFFFFCIRLVYEFRFIVETKKKKKVRRIKLNKCNISNMARIILLDFFLN